MSRKGYMTTQKGDLKEITGYEYIKDMQELGEEKLKEFGIYDEVQEKIKKIMEQMQKNK